MKPLRLNFIKVAVICSAFLLFSKFWNGIFAQDDLKEDKLYNVIIITFSGLNNIDSIQDPYHQYIPNFWNILLKEGTLYTDLVNLNYQVHMPAVHAILTGITNPYHKAQLDAPSIFQYVRKKYNLPRYKLWSISHWTVSDFALNTEDYPEDTFPAVVCFMQTDISEELKQVLNKEELSFWDDFPQAMEKNPEKWPNWDSIGVVQYQMFKKIMPEFKPKLVHYVMNDVESAHSDTFARYVLSLKSCDEKIYQLWRYIQSDPFYKDKTYLIINVDHERNTYYMEHFDNAYTNPGHVWMYIYGPGVKKGEVFKRPVYHIDIFATIAYIFNVDTHPTKGKFLKDCFYGEKIPDR